MSNPSGNSNRIQFFIIRKLNKVGAISKESSVFAEEAGLTVHEVSWLPYFTSGWYSRIGKTKNSKFYVKT
jgi:hypothetical protein